MTAPALAGADGPSSVLGLVAALRRDLAEVERLLGPDVAAPGQAEELALRRLLTGSSGPTDGAFLRVPVHGARVVVVHAEEQVCLQLWHRLGDSRRRQLVRTREGELAVVVAGRPRPGQLDESVLRVVGPAAQGGARAVGVSAALVDGRELATAYADASDAARLAAERRVPHLVADEHWAALSARRLASPLSSCLPADNPLRRLREHDQAQGTELVLTVATWLASGADTVEAARTLSVHVNTLRYRLRRAEAVSGLDLADPVARALLLLLTAD